MALGQPNAGLAVCVVKIIPDVLRCPVGTRRPPPHPHLNSRRLLDTRKLGIPTDLRAEVVYIDIVASLFSAEPGCLFRGSLMVNPGSLLEEV